MDITRRSFMQTLLAASMGPAIIGSGILMPIAAPTLKPIILPDSKDLILPGDVQIIATHKTASGHRLGLKTDQRIVYVDAVLPAIWWTDIRSRQAYAAKLYSERTYRA